MGNTLNYDFTNESPDIPLKEFWSDNVRFADLFNCCMFDGAEILKPEHLKNMDRDVSVSIFSEKFQQTIKRARDILKMTKDGVCYRILGMENQQMIHYAMPLRTMVYDGLTYIKQMEHVAKQNRKEKKFNQPEEFLSGWRKNDKLHPCYTLVVYWGEKPWDGPRSLSDMMRFSKNDPTRQYFADYSMKLLCANEFDPSKARTEDVFQLFTAVRALYRSGGEHLPKVLSEVNLDVAYVASLVTKTTRQYGKLIQQAKSEGKETINMCEAVERALYNREEKGKLTLAYELVKDGIMTMAHASQKLGLTEEEFRERIIKFDLDKV